MGSFSLHKLVKRSRVERPQIQAPKYYIPVKPSAIRERFRGSGIMMRLQFRKETLVKGDTCWDADEGYLEWTGTEWINSEG